MPPFVLFMASNIIVPCSCKEVRDVARPKPLAPSHPVDDVAAVFTRPSPVVPSLRFTKRDSGHQKEGILTVPLGADFLDTP